MIIAGDCYCGCCDYYEEDCCCWLDYILLGATVYVYIYVYIDVMKLFYKADGHSFFCVFTRGVDYERTLSGDRRIHPLT